MSSFEQIRTRLLNKVDKRREEFTLKDVSVACDVHYNTAWKWSRSEGFPMPLRIGRRPRWLVDDLVWWMMREEN